MIERLTSTITAQGSDYTIQWIGIDYSSNLSTSNSANETITVVASKFGGPDGFLTKFTEALNMRQEELSNEETGSQKVPDVYEYKISPDWANKTLAPHFSSDFAGPQPSQSIDIADFDLGALHIDNTTASRSMDIVPEIRRPGSPHPNSIKITMSLGTSIDDHVVAVFLNTIQITETSINAFALITREKNI